MFYKRLTHTLGDKGILIPFNENPALHIDDKNTDWYLSVYDYNQEHYNQFNNTGSISGITDVTTTRLVWDFDHSDLSQTKNDVLLLVNRLKNEKVDPKDIVICFSGNKGFHVYFDINTRINVEEFKSVTKKLAQDLISYDAKICNASRILRVVNTKHPVSGLYKTPFLVKQIQNFSIDKIKDISASPDGNGIIIFSNHEVKLNPNLFIPVKEKKSIVLAENTKGLNFGQKIKGWSNCKWALYNGYEVKGGNRHEKLLCIIATSKALNFPKESAYYNAKNAYEQGIARYHEEKKPDWKEEIWRDVESVYNGTWKGGTFSCKDGKTEWLTDLCQSLGTHACRFGDIDTVDADQIFGLFQNYAENYENNILETGIAPLDEKAKFLVGTSVGILAPPGVGKTSFSLDLLKHNSSKGVHSIFFSYDMFHSMVYLRLVQKHFHISQEEVFKKFKTSKNEVFEWQRSINDHYRNVKFCFKSGQTPDEIYETILDLKNKGVDLKLVVVDYNELVLTGVNDPTQSSAIVAQRLRQIANDTETCVVTLLQPTKHVSNPSEEITTYQGAKGSGAIAQSLSLMLSLSRPGFNPRQPENDRFLTINALKNRQGPLFTLDLGWDGLSGDIFPLSDEDNALLNEIREQKKIDNQEIGSNGGLG